MACKCLVLRYRIHLLRRTCFRCVLQSIKRFAVLRFWPISSCHYHYLLLMKQNYSHFIILRPGIWGFFPTLYLLSCRFVIFIHFLKEQSCNVLPAYRHCVDQLNECRSTTMDFVVFWLCFIYMRLTEQTTTCNDWRTSTSLMMQYVAICIETSWKMLKQFTIMSVLDLLLQLHDFMANFVKPTNCIICLSVLE